MNTEKLNEEVIKQLEKLETEALTLATKHNAAVTALYSIRSGLKREKDNWVAKGICDFIDEHKKDWE